jgi:peptidoglycan/LPS O-acetylase OafA/YrhL
MYLAHFSYSRDNNFNLLRIAAALSVLITHSFALAIGSGDAEPLRSSIGITLGTIAVDIFFIASGFLVTASLLRSTSIIDYFWARVLRIFPGLLMMLLLTVFVVGPALSMLPMGNYLSSPETYNYLIHCATLIRGVSYELPGLFENTPWKKTVNGSLWTLPIEVKMYSLLAAAWILLSTARSLREPLLKMATIACAIISCILVIYFRLADHGAHLFLRLLFMFSTGASFFFLKHRIQLSHTAFFCMLTVVTISAFVNSLAFFMAYTLGVAYMTFYLAYIPAGFLRKYNKFGDYSYGVYIYAFPVQQSVAALVPHVSVLEMLSISLVITLTLAVLSWNFIERNALGLKPWLMARTHRMPPARS